MYYHDGVGTGGNLDKYTGGAFGHGIEDNIRDLYRFLLYNYMPGDELYLLGFSRGAFTVRTLAGFMNQVGLVEKDDDYYVPEIYACYESTSRRISGVEEGVHNIKTCVLPRNSNVRVWDTVGALGAPGFLGQLFNGKKYQYHDIGLTTQIDTLSRHGARRASQDFSVNLWARPPQWPGVLSRCGFCGVHCNVGGATSRTVGKRGFHWMAQKPESRG